MRILALLSFTLLFSVTTQAQFGFKKGGLGDKVKSAAKEKADTAKDTNLQEAAAFKLAEKKLSAITKKTNKQCKLKMTGAFDKASFTGKLKDKDLKALGGVACEEALVAVQGICRKKSFRKKLKKVKKYTCKMAGGKSKLKMDGAEHLVAEIQPSKLNIDKFKVDVVSFFASKKKK